jgi:replicative DNA helicase
MLTVDVEAERILIGALIVNPTLMDGAADLVQPAHFSQDAFKWAYEALGSILQRADEVNIVTVRREVEAARGGLPDDFREMLYATVDGLPKMSDAMGWARRVREAARRRTLVAQLKKAVESGEGASTETDDIIGKVQATLQKLSEAGGSTRTHELSAILKQTVEELEIFAKAPNGLTGLPTGIRELDELTSGWQRGSVNVIAARPGRGKSVFCVQTALAAAQANKSVLIFSLEMPPPQVAQRMILGESHVDKWELRSYSKSSAAWERISKAVGRLSDLPIMLDDRESPTLAQIAATARRIKANRGLDLLVVDYLQRCSVDRKVDRWKAIGEFMLGLKSLAMSLNIPVIVAAQLNRDADTARPSLAMLREAGDIEQEADTVAFFHPAEPGAMEKDEAPVDFILEKNRHGATTSIPLTLQRRYTRFTNRIQADIVAFGA